MNELVLEHVKRVQGYVVSAKYATGLPGCTIVANIFPVDYVLTQVRAVNVHARPAFIAVYYRVLLCISRKADLAHIVISYFRLVCDVGTI